MFRDLFMALWVIIPVSVLSAALGYWRAEQLLGPDRIPADSLASERIESAKGWIVLALLFGLLAGLLYVWMSRIWPETAPQIYLQLGIVSVVSFSVLALLVCPKLKKRCIAEYVTLNLIWGIGYGFVMPLLMRLG